MVVLTVLGPIRIATTTATRFNDEWTFGAQLKAKIHLDDNDRGYAPGDEFTSSVWASRELTERFTASLRLQGQIRQDYRGFDSETNMMRNMTPTADAEIRGGSRIDVLPGLSYAFEAQELSNRLAVEVGFPVYEKVEGVNLETDLTVNASWQLLF